MTPLIFVGMGWGIDRLAGTEPLFTVAVAVFGIAGTMVKLWLGYDRDMQAQDVGKPWARGRTSTQPQVAAPVAAEGDTR